MKAMRRVLAVLLVLAMLLTNCDMTALADAILTMPAAVRIIEEEAFYGSTSIDKVVLSDEVTEIHTKAFANSTLSEINLPDSLTYIADDAFDGPEKVTVSVNPGTYAYEWADQHLYLDDPNTIRLGQTKQVTISGADEVVRYSFVPEEDGKYVFFSEGCEYSITDNAFDNCQNLKACSIPYDMGEEDSFHRIGSLHGSGIRHHRLCRKGHRQDRHGH